MSQENQSDFIDEVNQLEDGRNSLQDKKQPKKPLCFYSTQRYLCQGKCEFYTECKKLIAEWLR